MNRLKKYSIITLITLALLLLVELGFYIFIGGSHYPTKLRNLLAYTSKNIEPTKAQAKLDWPAKSILIRTQDISAKPETLKIGGKEIPGTYLKPAATFKEAKELQENGTKNIYVVGGSAAFGYTCSYTQTFATILDNQLGDEYSVYNAAQVGWNSGQLVPVVKRIADVGNPSLVIIFCANNELINWSLSQPSPKFGYSRKALRLYSNSHTLSYLMYQKIMRLNGKRQYANPLEFRPHHELIGYKTALQHPADRYTNYDFSLWIKKKAEYLTNFENNLTTMIYFCKKAGADILLMNMPFQYRLSPVWKHPQPWFYNKDHKEEIPRKVAQAVRYIETNQTEAAIAALDKAIKLEPEVGMLHYLKAYCLEKSGQMLKAETTYSKSRDLMVGNLGSIPSFNQVIEKVAKGNDIDMINLKSIFDEYGHEHGSYFNELLIRDDCHPSDIGQQLIAENILDYLEKNDFNRTESIPD